MAKVSSTSRERKMLGILVPACVIVGVARALGITTGWLAVVLASACIGLAI